MKTCKGQRLRTAANDLRDAERKLAEAVEREFPDRAPISWRRGRSKRERFGRVIWTSGERIKVENAENGKRYVVSLYDVLASIA